MGSKSGISGNRRLVVAIIVIAPAFIILAAMLGIHYESNQAYLEEFKSGNFTDTNTKQNFKDMVDAVDKSNQTLFNILIPVMAAWVGTVVAFYFGSESLDRAQRMNETLSKITSGKTENITLRELLDLYPDSKNVKTVSFDDDFESVIKETKSFGNAAVVESDGIKGIIYFTDIKNEKGKHSGKKFEAVIKTEEVTDHIKEERWTKKGITNYAILEYKNTLTQAKEKLESVKSGHHDVIGVILDKDKKPEAAISFHTLAKNLDSK